jgi:hypothetical protein
MTAAHSATYQRPVFLSNPETMLYSMLQTGARQSRVHKRLLALGCNPVPNCSWKGIRRIYKSTARRLSAPVLVTPQASRVEPWSFPTLEKTLFVPSASHTLGELSDKGIAGREPISSKMRMVKDMSTLSSKGSEGGVKALGKCMTLVERNSKLLTCSSPVKNSIRLRASNGVSDLGCKGHPTTSIVAKS